MHEAVRELEAIKTRDDVGLGAMLALVYTHKKFSSVDKESVGELDARIKEISEKADEKVIFRFKIGRATAAKKNDF